MIRVEPSFHLKAKPIIVFEGIHALYDPRIVDTLDFKIFLNADDDIRLVWRIKRDVEERQWTVESILISYNKFGKPSYEEFIKPTMKKADMIIPKGVENKIAITLVIDVL